ncbi:MAG TPA: sugar nucleotide-binding protein [Candidatus Magasanikbacteria bacterium]|mgnify:CR=1 FL=1|nr:sugar nucleotide-binding protein [Candidatus Magasanikbacteria bacterium]
MNINKALIIGAAGTLGTALQTAFKGKKIPFVAWDKADGDILDMEGYIAKVRNLRPDVIFNCAAINNVNGIETDDKMLTLANMINGEFPGKLGILADEIGATLVHYSSDYIFQGDKNSPYSETDIGNPISKYGATKLLGENSLLKTGKKFYIIRLSRLFGARGTGPESKLSFVDLMLDLVENKGKTELNVVNDEIASPTYAPDLAGLSIDIVMKELPYGTYHGTNSGECSWYQFAVGIFKLKGIDVKINPVKGEFFPRPALPPPYSVLANNKLPHQRTWQEALAEYLKDEDK